MWLEITKEEIDSLGLFASVLGHIGGKYTPSSVLAQIPGLSLSETVLDS